RRAALPPHRSAGVAAHVRAPGARASQRNSRRRRVGHQKGPRMAQRESSAIRAALGGRALFHGRSARRNPADACLVARLRRRVYGVGLCARPVRRACRHGTAQRRRGVMRAHHYAGAVLPSDPGLRFSFGFTGSGKTFGTRAQVFAALRASPPLAVLALDPTAEWASVPRDIARVTAGATDIDTAARHVKSGARLVIVRSDEEPRELLEAACAWAREHAAAWRSRSPGRHALAGIMAPEAHRCAPVRFHELPRHTSAVATAWRHERVALWLDTQRPALVS